MILRSPSTTLTDTLFPYTTRFRSEHRVAALLHDQLDERVARAGGRRRAEHFDFLLRQRWIDVAPHPVWIRDQLAVDRHLSRESEEDLLLRQRRLSGLVRIGDDDAVIADLHLGDVLDAVPGAVLEL